MLPSVSTYVPPRSSAPVAPSLSHLCFRGYGRSPPPHPAGACPSWKMRAHFLPALPLSLISLILKTCASHFEQFKMSDDSRSAATEIVRDACSKRDRHRQGGRRATVAPETKAGQGGDHDGTIPVGVRGNAGC